MMLLESGTPPAQGTTYPADDVLVATIRGPLGWTHAGTPGRLSRGWAFRPSGWGIPQPDVRRPSGNRQVRVIWTKSRLPAGEQPRAEGRPAARRHHRRADVHRHRLRQGHRPATARGDARLRPGRRHRHRAPVSYTHLRAHET